MTCGGTRNFKNFGGLPPNSSQTKSKGSSTFISILDQVQTWNFDSSTENSLVIFWNDKFERKDLI